jgi:hypothetical protein
MQSLLHSAIVGSLVLSIEQSSCQALSFRPPEPWSSTSNSHATRRGFFGQTITTVAAVTTAGVVVSPSLVPNAFAVSSSATSEYLQELQASKSKISDIPNLLQEQEWDKVRTILKTPPVNKLWNLGDSQNTVLKLAKESGNVDLFEIKDDLAYNLQMCDQLTYDNVFVYYQPGNGKIKIKEPQDFANRALQQLEQIIQEES